MRARAEVVHPLRLIEIAEAAAAKLLDGGNWDLGDPNDLACLCGLIGAQMAEDLAQAGVISIGAGPLFDRLWPGPEHAPSGEQIAPHL